MRPRSRRASRGRSTPRLGRTADRRAGSSIAASLSASASESLDRYVDRRLMPAVQMSPGADRSPEQVGVLPDHLDLPSRFHHRRVRATERGPLESGCDLDVDRCALRVAERVAITGRGEVRHVELDESRLARHRCSRPQRVRIDCPNLPASQRSPLAPTTMTAVVHRVDGPASGRAVPV